MEAAAKGAVDEINALVEAGADPSYQDEAEGVSPLMRAAENGHLDAVVALLEAGAPWNAQDHEGYCAGGRPRPRLLQLPTASSCRPPAPPARRPLLQASTPQQERTGTS